MFRILKVCLPLLLLSTACAPALSEQAFDSTDIVWTDPDKNPIPKPAEYWSGLLWDGADKMFFEPVARFWLFEVHQPAVNVNALQEVPNSSWYTNRMALAQISPERVARGPCGTRRIDTESTWLVTSGKVDGANPGFTIEDTSDGRKYLLKFDGADDPERATTADVIGSKIYWAAGFETPCNEVVHFDPSILTIADSATKKDSLGRKTPMTQKDVDEAMAGVRFDERGFARGSASLFITGFPIGPFTYEGTRPDDPNDVIPHEDRRELRGSKLLAAWLNHFDAREQNTLTSFVSDREDDLGYVQHYIIDWGDCFGSQWDNDLMSRRFGHSSYFDFQHVGEDLLTLGLIERPWDEAKIPEEAPLWGYYDVERFEPEKWQNGYRHEAFDRMDDTDAWWMTRTISRFSDAHIDELVKLGELSRPADARLLASILKGRRDKIVHHYFGKMSALDSPRIIHRDGGAQMCVSDLVVSQGYDALEDAWYEFEVDGTVTDLVVRSEQEVCVPVDDSADALLVTGSVRRTDSAETARPVRFHFRRRPDGSHAWTGTERFEDIRIDSLSGGLLDPISRVGPGRTRRRRRAESQPRLEAPLG